MKKIIFIVLLVIIGLLTACNNNPGKTQETPIPTEEKSQTEILDIEPDPSYHGVTFSRKSGFYEDSFLLKMYSDGGRIFYTLDGTVPTENSLKYEEPIEISDATLLPNIHSLRTDVSAGFLPNVNYGYAVPNYNVDKCTNIRAICCYDDGTTSKIENVSYFVGFDSKTGYENMNIISIITDPENLFNYEKGIYVLGNRYTKYKMNRERGLTYWYDAYWWWFDANYHRDGDFTEKEAVIVTFNQNHTLTNTKNIGIRIQGGGSRGRLPRSLNLYARNKYDGSNNLGFRPFETSYKPQRVTLFAGGDDNETKFNDWLCASLCENCDFVTMDFTPYVLFLDGEYWGNYWMTSKYDEEYIHFTYDVRKDNIVIVKNGAIEEGTSSDIGLYQTMTGYISGNDMSKQSCYDKACDMLDIDSYISYMAAEVYFARYNDWPGGNFALWRTRTTETDSLGNVTEYGDCRWRYMLFDLNSGCLESERVNVNSLEYLINSDKVFRSLWKNKEFKEKFKKQLISYANNEFSEENVQAKYDIFMESMGKNMTKEFERFYQNPDEKYDAFVKHLEDVKMFFEKRKAVIEKIVKNS